MNLTEFAKEVHQNAVDHGWWEGEISFSELIALCHSELSEALEEYRNNRPMVYVDRYETEERITEIDEFQPGEKPEGIVVELADCVIRILDWCGKEDIDIEIRMKTRWGAGRNQFVPNLITECHWALSTAWVHADTFDRWMYSLSECIYLIQKWCASASIDLDRIMCLKHEYNKTRPYRHGGKRC